MIKNFNKFNFLFEFETNINFTKIIQPFSYLSTEHPTVPRKTLRKHASLKRQDSDENFQKPEPKKMEPVVPYDVKVVTVSANQRANDNLDPDNSAKMSLENVDKNYDENTIDLRKRVEEWLSSSTSTSS